MDIRILSLFFVLGVYLADKISFAHTVFVGMGMFILCIIRAVAKKPTKIIIPLSVVSLVMGVALYKKSASEEFLRSTQYISENVAITGCICDIPEQTGNVMKYYVDADTINGENLNERILIYSPIVFDYGSNAVFEGELEKLPRIRNFGDNNIYEHYRHKGVTAKMIAHTAQLCNVQTRSAFTIFSDIKYSLANLIDDYYTGDHGAALKAVILGQRNDFSDETEKVILRSGTRSLFYPAYIHLMLFTMILGILTEVVNRKYRDFLIAALAILYLAFNFQHASFVRTFMFAAALPLSRRFFKKANYSDIVFCVILVAGIINPLILKNVGFVMSVVCAVLIRCFRSFIFKQEQGWIVSTIRMQLAASILTLPLAIYYFGGISPYLPLVAPIFLAAVIGILIIAPILLILLAMTGTAPVIGTIASYFAAVLVKLPHLIDKLPFSHTQLASPSIIVIAAHFIAITGIVYIIKKKNVFKDTLLILSAVLFIFAGLWEFTKLDKAEIRFVNVGHGDAAVISTVLGENILIDGGGSIYSDYNIGENVFVPYLIRNGITQIDAAFVSHYHGDHTQGIVAAVESLNVRNLFLPSPLPENEYFTELEEAAKKSKTKVHYITSNTKITFADGLMIDITIPDALTQKSDDENDNSLLMNVSYGEFNCLFTGDMTHFAEKNLLAKDMVCEADVLKVAHHGSSSSTSAEFFNAVLPKFSVISVDEDNSYGLPSPSVLDTIKASQILRTDLLGEIIINSDKEGKIRIKTLR